MMSLDKGINTDNLMEGGYDGWQEKAAIMRAVFGDMNIISPTLDTVERRGRYIKCPISGKRFVGTKGLLELAPRIIYSKIQIHGRFAIYTHTCQRPLN